MPVAKKKFREMVFQLLYSHNLSEAGRDDIVPLMREQLNVSRSSLHQAHARMLDVVKHQEEFDRLVKETSREYEVERIQRVEMNILRLGLYEMIYDDHIPPKVAIAEALRLGKKFSTPESVKFLNAILDAVYKSLDIAVEQSDETKEETFFSAEDERKKRES